MFSFTHKQSTTMYMDDLDPESGDAMDAILSNAVGMLGTSLLLACWFDVCVYDIFGFSLIRICCDVAFGLKLHYSNAALSLKSILYCHCICCCAVFVIQTTKATPLWMTTMTLNSAINPTATPRKTPTKEMATARANGVVPSRPGASCPPTPPMRM